MGTFPVGLRGMVTGRCHPEYNEANIVWPRMRTRRFALAFIVFLVVADALGAGYLWLRLSRNSKKV